MSKYDFPYDDGRKSGFWEGVNGIICAILMFGVPSGCTYALWKDSHDTWLKCKAEHHGQDYVIETPFATTSDGCTVIEIQKYEGVYCNSRGYVYVTNCKGGVSWDERVGKHTERRSTATQ